MLVCALMGVMVAGLAQGATIRYKGSGDYFDLETTSAGGNGWQSPTVPGSADTIRVNWGNNLVILTNVAPNVARFQIGVDESGHLVVDSGGKLTATGTSANRVGNNGGPAVIGRLTVNTNGEVNSTAVLEVGASATGILTIDGGTVNLSNHLWVGSSATGAGTILLTNGGTLNLLGVNGNGMLGLGTINATAASGGTGILKVNGGGVLNLFNISASGLGSIQPGSVLDISGSGVVTIPGDRVAVISAYTNAGRITAYGGTGTVGIDYNTANAGKTTLTAIGGYTPPTEAVWNPTVHPAGTALWRESANWNGGLRPAGVTKVILNMVGAPPCTVDDSAMANQVVMGENGPGGTLIITNGGLLICGAEAPSIIGYNSNALLVVETGAVATFGHELAIGLNFGADGTLLMNGGTVSVAGLFSLGYLGGKGTARINGGTLNLSQWDDFMSIQGTSVMDVSGTGKVVINGDHQASMAYYITMGQLIANGGAGTVVVDYNNINVGKTTVYPLGLDLPPAQVTWNPALNFPDTSGLWNVRSNWNLGMCPGNVTIVTFNVPEALPCTVTNAAVAGYVAMGINNGPGGTLIITNGGSLTTFSDHWSAVGYNSSALLVVENGGSVNFANHLWIGLDPGSDGTLILNGGTVSVGTMFGMGWQGGKGTAQINGGTLQLSQWHPTDSIKGASVMNLTGTGTVLITGNHVASIGSFVSSGKITANGGPNVVFGYDPEANKTIIQVAPPRQSVTGVTVSGANTRVTCQTTPGHIYHLESTASVSPASWTRVAGSTTNATGTSVTFSFPASGDPMFYRAVSP